MDDETNVPVEKTYSLELEGLYRTLRGVFGFILRLFVRLDVRGREHIPADGPYLMVVNHLHWLDSPVLMVALPYRTHVFAADKRRTHWFFGPLFNSLDAIWVRRGEVDRQALRQALAVLQGGGVLGMAPEGTRSTTGGLQKGRGGAAYLAFRSGAPVVPVVITGQEKVFPPWKRKGRRFPGRRCRCFPGWLRRAVVRVSFGPALAPPPVAAGGRVSSADLRAFTQEIMDHLAAMLPDKYRGVYGDVAERRPDLVASGPASRD